MITEFDKRMKSLEVFSNVAVSEGTFFAIRLDGRGFSSMTERHFLKPFDDTFFKFMDSITQTLMLEMGAMFAFTQSDEISLIFDKDHDVFDRRIEKLVSVSAGIASSNFSKLFGDVVTFDSRIVSFSSAEEMIDYLHWRSSDGLRNSLNTACYWTMRNSGMSASAATRSLAQMLVVDKQEFLGKKWTDQPLRNTHGCSFVWTEYEKIGFNPKLQIEELAVRRKIVPLLSDKHKDHANALLQQCYLLQTGE